MLTKIIKDLMKYFLITLLIMASLLYGCGRFENSPYGADAYSTQLNEQAVRQILAIPINKTSYKVAFISDTHNYYDEMEKLVNKINKGNYAFVIHAGDITNFGLNREFQTSLKIYNCTLSLVFKSLNISMLTPQINVLFCIILIFVVASPENKFSGDDYLRCGLLGIWNFSKTKQKEQHQ